MEVNFPAGIDSGNELRVAHRGNFAKGHKGHLYVHVSVDENPEFEREGSNVHSDANIR